MDKSRTSGEWEWMVSGRLYTPVDPKIAKRHRVGMRRCDRVNRLPLWCTKTKQRALERLIPSAEGKNFEAFAPFYCEYGVKFMWGGTVSSTTTAYFWMWRPLRRRHIRT